MGWIGYLWELPHNDHITDHHNHHHLPQSTSLERSLSFISYNGLITGGRGSGYCKLDDDDDDNEDDDDDDDYDDDDDDDDKDRFHA